MTEAGTVTDAVLWAAVGAVAAIGAFSIAFALFWFNLGNRIKGSDDKAEAASIEAQSARADAKVALVGISDLRSEVFKNYVSNEDLVKAETRIADSVDGVWQEVRGQNQRLDRIIEHLAGIGGSGGKST